MTDTKSNVTQITDKQTAPACKFNITCTLDGFPIVLEGEGRAADLRLIIDRLKQIGAEPPQAAIAQPTKPAGAPAEDAPVCEYHGAMKPSKFGGWFCPKKMGDGSHCKSKA